MARSDSDRIEAPLVEHAKAMLALLRESRSPRLVRSVEPLARLRRELNARFAEGDPPTRGPLSPAERAALQAGGFRLEKGPRGRSEYEQLLASCLGVEQAAERLGVNTSRIRQRLLEGTLYGIKHEGRWLLPRFQFSAKGVVPGLSEVLPAIKEKALHPVAVQRWLTSPHPDLVTGDDEAPVAPLDWLREGHGASKVIELIEAL